MTIKAWLVTLALFLLNTVIVAQKAQYTVTTTGPTPPRGVLPATGQPLSGPDANPTLIYKVPMYKWHHGCTPTSLGMIIGFYDGTTNNLSRLIPGNAATQTIEVNSAIATEGSKVKYKGTQRHYEDYCLPMDDTSSSPKTDNSYQYPQNCHIDECLADYLRTSWSSMSCRYGWTDTRFVPEAFKRYVKSKSANYIASVNYHTSLTWAELKNSIDQAHPILMSVDTKGDGRTDHSVVVVGYNIGPNNRLEYGCHDTWDTQNIRWEPFRKASSAYKWGTGEGWTFRVNYSGTIQYYTDGKSASYGRYNSIPFSYYTGPRRYQVLIPKASYGLPSIPATLSSIAFSATITKSNPNIIKTFIIRVGHTSATSLGPQFSSPYGTETPVTVLNQSNYTWNIFKDTWNRISLDAPFFYDGKSNLVIDMVIDENGDMPGFHMGDSAYRCYGPVSFGTGGGKVSNFGAGCKSSTGKPASIQSAGFPLEGTGLFNLVIKGVPTGTPSFLMWGINRNRLGTLPLPLDLSLFGATNCFLSVEPISVFTGNAQGAFSLHWWDTIPSRSVVTSYFQWYALDSKANTLGLITSNGLLVNTAPCLSATPKIDNLRGIRVELGF